jgi:adenosylcobyric acid synthase
MAKSIMVQGTGSHVGKSLLVTGLCRLFSKRGLRVAPFKAQNMALNSYITADGKEIGRAQGTQAEAAGVIPTVDMNPILLKATSDTAAQVIVLGRPVGNMNVQEYRRFKPEAWNIIRAAYERLAAAYDLIVIEGAGSPAEINLKSHDIVNMKVALFADAPVLLVGDIDRGGVFASFVGTWELLEPEERARIAGFVINKFRGDAGLLQEGIDFLQARTGRPTFGVVPYLPHLLLPEEDGVALGDRDAGQDRLEGRDPSVQIAVIRLPHISNFTDFDPFLSEPSVRLSYVDPFEQVPKGTDVIILPGTKNTLEDLEILQKSGMADQIRLHAARGKMIVGICGGYQMLGASIEDPYHVESTLGRMSGLQLLPIQTTFDRQKITAQVAVTALPSRSRFSFLSIEGVMKGYEIHMGKSVAIGQGRALFRIIERNGIRCDEEEGIGSFSGEVWGCYLHGLFENDRLRLAFLDHFRIQKSGGPAEPAQGRPAERASEPAPAGERRHQEIKEAMFDRLESVLLEHLDWKKLDDLL